MKKIRIKARVVPQPCPYSSKCSGACKWCETHSYSEACVPMLQQVVQRKNNTIKELRESRTEYARENSILREKLGIDDVW